MGFGFAGSEEVRVAVAPLVEALDCDAVAPMVETLELDAGAVLERDADAVAAGDAPGRRRGIKQTADKTKNRCVIRATSCTADTGEHGLALPIGPVHDPPGPP